MGNSASAEVSATVDLKPTRSQPFLVSLTILAGISVICGTGLLSLGNPAGWGLLAFAAVSIGAGVWAWRQSQPDVDLENAQPTSFTLPDGTSVVADARLLRSLEGTTALVRLIEGVLHRRPLPEPDGLVDSNGQPIPDSKAAAAALIHKVNSDTQLATNQICDALGLSVDSPHALQEIPNATDTGPESVTLSGLNCPPPSQTVTTSPSKPSP
ncbi:MAG: hypothetical protein GAKPKEKM_00082 [Rhodocyclaceae bacterium]|nr:hypothetical protein [Rhodocyclaceae bacterium]